MLVESRRRENVKMVHKSCWTPISGLWNNCRKSAFEWFVIIIFDYGDNDMFSWGENIVCMKMICSITEEDSTHEYFYIFICILICWMADWIIKYIVGVMTPSESGSQSKPKLVWYFTLTPVSWMKRGSVQPPRFSLFTSGLRLWPSRAVKPAVDPCWSLICNAFNFAVDTCKRLYLLWSAVTVDLFLTWSCS